ncbi:uncharacterized protein EURHEDRAFT_453069 [Aspergillus ruber CBS 135680]|uniref:Cysteine-rich transmembrane CYSTM domain-containing protein n=1 Tax=Aspergillus ruber (strain CBS 135680) TaxID=1388766 RepID=A0A017SHZ4_ASPRC|nr:uncharacterized protein EURHEDRAFT_453069 [Aspergillus ruber CBS 135680]EYE96533.1 hypothetical protein EURHEDRAFT_453069 [Aspergillus ruber CBS 135680]
MGLFDWFRSSKQEDSSTQQSSWDPNTMTMNKPSSPSAHKAERVVIQQPNSQKNMQTNLRGGAGAGDICCGVCTGLLCFECCEDCC